MPRSLQGASLVGQAEPALFLYRQCFRLPGNENESIREGVMGLLNRHEALVLPHEETEVNRVSACIRTLESGGSDPGSLWLWCNDSDGSLKPLMNPTGPACIEGTDRFGCHHQFWPVKDPERIERFQNGLAAKSLFLADGHHRFAAGWSLATIQLRNSSLRSLPSHRVLINAGNFRLNDTKPIGDAECYLASAPAGYWRLVVVKQGPVFEGAELPDAISLKGLIGDATVAPVREIARAIALIQAGYAQMALLVPPFSIEQIEANARSGLLLPPKSTDFFPKLAAGLVMHLPQKEKTNPPVAQRPGVRNPSS